ncbi:MAG: rod shape-determining protein MreC [Fidelibacterota bacterium]
MRNLYLSLLRYKDHFLFLIAITVSLTVLLKNDSTDIYILRGKTSDLFAMLSSPVVWVKTLITLEEETQRLREKNIQLSLQNQSMLYALEENQQLRELLGYKNESSLTLFPARVVNTGITSNMTSITLDAGSSEGIKPNQPVITPDGVVGKTVVVGEKSVVVQLLSDLNYRLSVRILPSNSVGILVWKQDDICEVREIQKNARIHIGDRVVTSGFSKIYPPNLSVGKIIAISDERGRLQKTALVKIGPDLNSLMNVFIISGKIDEVE